MIEFRNCAAMLLCCFGLLISTSAWADPEYEACVRGTGQESISIRACGTDLIKRWDRRVDEAFVQALAKLREVGDAGFDIEERQGAVNDLIEEQRVWKEFRAVACKYHERAVFGRIGVLIRSAICVEGISSERVGHLEWFTQ